MTDIKAMQKKEGSALNKDRMLSIRDSLEKQEMQLKNALPRTITPQRFLRIVYTAIHMNPKLLDCSKESLVASIFKAAERGFFPNGRHAALVPYWNGKKRVFEAQFQEMYQGLIYAAKKSGDIVDIIPATIHENDEWQYELGLHPDLIHRPALGNRGNPIAYYAVITFADGSRSFGPGPMGKEDIDSIRARSKSKDTGPWVTDYESMAWKTVIKRNLKYIGASPEVDEQITEDDEVEFGPMPAAGIEVEVRQPEWPKETTDGHWYDSSGQVYDERYHAKPMTVTTKGLFRRRKGTSGLPRPEMRHPSPEALQPAEVPSGAVLEPQSTEPHIEPDPNEENPDVVYRAVQDSIESAEPPENGEAQPWGAE